MKSWKKPTNELIDRAYRMMKKQFDHEYFFTRLKNPLWIQPLVARGCFHSPPKMRKLPGGYIQTPVWPELRYLKNLVSDATDEVLEVVRTLPEVDNPRVYDDIIDITLQLDAKRSAKLLSKILESIGLERPIWGHKYADVLVHWTIGNETSAALELTKKLVEFVPDPQDKIKRKRRGEKSKDTAAIATNVAETQLNPAPRIDDTEYLAILSEGVQSLTKKEPYGVARILTNATAKMICLRTHHDDLNKNVDYSEYWCERLTKSEGDYEDAEKLLVHTLTFACDQIYRKLPHLVSELDRTLRKQQLRTFKRLRYHLYAQHPNETTKPWIQKLIREHEGYDWLQHGYEFQRMVRRACEHFGNTLIAKEECIRIFDSILDGPSEANHRVWVEGILGEELTMERLKKHTCHFHRMQLRPFERLLFGKYAAYFRELEQEAESPILDDNYGPSRIQTSFGPNDHSPITPEELANYDDEKLLDCINHWHKEEVFYDGKRYMRVNIQGLSQAFETVFKKSIIPNSNRLMFWMGNLEKVERPIFLEKMLAAMRERIKTNNFDKLNDWLEFCHRLLIHTDRRMKDVKKRDEDSVAVPEWYGPRRAVGDFIGAFFEKSADVPGSAYKQLTELFDLLCTQSDWCLDRNPNRFTPFTQSLNCIRSRALQDLVNFGLWLRRHDQQPDLSAVTRILERRFDHETQSPLTPPEYAILGVNFARIFSLNEEWSIKHKSDFFPQQELSSWLTAFGSFVGYSNPFEGSFKILRDDYNFALQYLGEFGNRDDSEDRLIDNLGQHLFIYYLWDMYSLSGHESLLKSYYDAADGNRDLWANLFDYVGRTLDKYGKDLEESLKEKIYRFFDWRFKFGEHKELQKITFWLKAEGLDAEWRLESYSKILNFCRAENIEITIQVEALCKMLPNHAAKVVECFAKLTQDIGERNIYIYTEKAKTIIQAGLASKDSSMHKNAEQAHENLLRIGRFDLMELGD